MLIVELDEIHSSTDSMVSATFLCETVIKLKPLRLPHQRLQHAIIRRLLDQRLALPTRLQELISISLAPERARDPRVRVIKVPDDDANAPAGLHARLDTVVVVEGLLRLGGGGGREIGADVELGNDGVDAECGVGLLLGELVGEGRGGAWGSVRVVVLYKKDRRGTHRR